MLESLAELHGFDRSTLVKTLLRKGMAELRLELAVKAFREERITLSRSSNRGFEPVGSRRSDEGPKLELHYDSEDFEADLAGLAQLPG